MSTLSVFYLNKHYLLLKTYKPLKYGVILIITLHLQHLNCNVFILKV